MLIPILTVLVVCNVLVMIYGLRDAVRSKHVILLFWIAVAYLTVIPLVIDSTAVCLSVGLKWQDILETYGHISWPYNLTPEMLVRSASFVLLFNLFVVLTLKFIQSKPSTNYSRNLTTPISMTLRSQMLERLSLAIALVASCILITTALVRDFYLPVIIALSRNALTVSVAGIYLSLLNKRYLRASAIAVPNLLTSAFFGSRPFLIPILACTLFSLLDNRRRFRLGNTVSLVVLSWIAVSILNLILTIRPITEELRITGSLGAMEQSPMQAVMSVMYPITRDESINNMYYCFDDLYYDIGTEAKGFQFLAATGGLHTSLGFSRAFALADVPAYIAQQRFGWATGSLHATIYGWTYTDMKWHGILFGVFVAIVAQCLELLSRQSISFRGLCVAAGSMFLFIGGRGSVQVGYSFMLYGLLLGSLVILAVRTACAKRSTYALLHNNTARKIMQSEGP